MNEISLHPIRLFVNKNYLQQPAKSHFDLLDSKPKKLTASLKFAAKALYNRFI